MAKKKKQLYTISDFNDMLVMIDMDKDKNVRKKMS